MNFPRAGGVATVLTAALFAALTSLPAQAQTAQGTGFDMTSEDPVHIEADVLEVFDESGTAVFTGNVVASQGPTTLQTTKLTVYYSGGAMMEQAEKDTGGKSQVSDGDRGIKRLEAEGQVVVSTQDQQATGAKAIFLMDENTVTLTGDVVLSQGSNVLRGTELVVDLDTGRSTLVSNEQRGKPGRVTGLFVPGSARPGAPAETQ